MLQYLLKSWPAKIRPGFLDAAESGAVLDSGGCYKQLKQCIVKGGAMYIK